MLKTYGSLVRASVPAVDPTSSLALLCSVSVMAEAPASRWQENSVAGASQVMSGSAGHGFAPFAAAARDAAVAIAANADVPAAGPTHFPTTGSSVTRHAATTAKHRLTGSPPRTPPV